MLLVTKEQKDKLLLHPQLEDLEDSERLLNQHLHLDSQQQLRREVYLVHLLLHQLVDYLVHLLLRHQRLDNLLQHPRLFLELLLRKHQLVDCSVRLLLHQLLGHQHLPLLLGLHQRLQLEVYLVHLQRLLLQREDCLVRPQHLHLLEDYLVRLLPLRLVVYSERPRLHLLEDYSAHQHLRLLVDYSGRPHRLQLVDYLAHLRLQLQ